ncbi:unnamed protein product, partial [Meganyctiphanes norvegica]
KFEETVLKGFESLTNAINQSNRMPVVPNFASITQQQQQQPPQQQQQQMTQQQGYQPNSSTPASQQTNQIGSIQQQQLETGTQVRQTAVFNQQIQPEGRYIKNREYFQDMRQERKKCMIVFGLDEFEELKTDESPTWDLYRAEQILKEMDQEYLCEKIACVIRLGNKEGAKIRPLRVIFKSYMDRESAVINGYKLRNSENYSNVYVSRDLIMEDRIRSRENYLKKRQARATIGNTQPTETQSAQQATLLATALVSLQAPVATETTRGVWGYAVHFLGHSKLF